MNKKVSNKENNLCVHKYISNNMGQSVPQCIDKVNDLYEKGILTENHLPPNKNENRMIMPYDIFMKNQYNM